MIWTPYIALTIALIPSLVWIVGEILRQRLYKKNRGNFRYFSKQESFDYALFDVRDKKSYERGHLPGAVHFPLEQVNYLPLEDMFINIFVYGGRRKQSRQAVEFLSKNGYFNVYDLGRSRFYKKPLERGRGTHIETFSSEIKKIRKKQEQA